MKINIELKQIIKLLDQQKALCRETIQKTLIDAKEKMKDYEIRDSVLGTDYPKDVQILSEYLSDESN